MANRQATIPPDTELIDLTSSPPLPERRRRIPDFESVPSIIAPTANPTLTRTAPTGYIQVLEAFNADRTRSINKTRKPKEQIIVKLKITLFIIEFYI